jgi:hypothetical protein
VLDKKDVLVSYGFRRGLCTGLELDGIGSLNVPEATPNNNQMKAGTQIAFLLNFGAMYALCSGFSLSFFSQFNRIHVERVNHA